MSRQVLARLGYAAVGILYITVGVIAGRIGLLGSRDRVAGMYGALRVLLRQTEGARILAAVASGLAAFAMWRLIQTFTSRRASFILRAGWFVAAVGYGLLALTGLQLLVRARAGYSLTRVGLDWLLASTVGRLALQIAGVVLVVAGVVAVVQGASGRLPRWLVVAGSHRRVARLITRLARLGLSARGVVGVVMGYFVLRAVADHDPREIHEIGGSLQEISRYTPVGPIVMGIVAVGLIFYGLAIWAVAVSSRPQ